MQKEGSEQAIGTASNNDDQPMKGMKPRTYASLMNANCQLESYALNILLQLLRGLGQFYLTNMILNESRH